MKDILYDYQMTATTWVYLSSLIMISVYFKFRRFWSVRNVDLIGLIFLAPGLLLVAHGESLLLRAAHPPAAESGGQPGAAAQQVVGEPTSRAEPMQTTSEPTEASPERAARGRQFVQRGYLWLFSVSLFFLLRMLIDSAMVRRPLLEPNLSASGLTFACASMLVFLMSNVITERPATDAAPAAAAGEKHSADTMDGEAAPAGHAAGVLDILRQRGPGYPWFQLFASDSAGSVQRIIAIVAHLSIVLGLVLIGYRHFDNTHTGIAAATLYLLLPYTAEYTPRIDHVVPGALLAWAIQCYRRPAFAGIFVGLAAGLTCYPLFLLPLWCSFYWRRGLVRFCVSVAVVLGLVFASLALMPSSLGSYWEQFLRTTGVWYMAHPSIIRGFWEPPLDPFRWPVMAVFFAICVTMIFWPAQKNLGTLLACSAAIMLATQFWKGFDGGTYMGWYLPLLILTILRPNLEDRVALSAVSEGWLKWRK